VYTSCNGHLACFRTVMVVQRTQCRGYELGDCGSTSDIGCGLFLFSRVLILLYATVSRIAATSNFGSTRF
jgi:hypothetical protein